MIFDSRRHAGQLLAAELEAQNIRPDLVYGLARGGVAVAAEIAAAFKVGLEALVVRKISPPGNPEFAVGAVAAMPGCEPSMEGSEPSIYVWWDKDTVRRLGLSAEWQKQQIRDKKLEISNYLSRISFTETPARSGSKLSNIVIVDDGAATGATMMAAIGAVRNSFRKLQKGVSLPRGKDTPLLIIVALPVASTEAAAKIEHQADETVILSVDPDFRAVGQYYRSFEQISWEEVREILKASRSRTE